jgi:hypothetical protein
MTKSRKKKSEPVEDLLRDILIVQLGLAGLTGHQIREIVGVDMNRVTRILKHLKKRKK